jgi:hypothetical protein
MHFIALARHLETQIERLMARQISYARYCRTRAAAVRESAEKITFPELQATLLRLALSYERIADSVELCIRRLADNAGKPKAFFFDLGNSASQKTRRGRRARVERGVKLNRSLVPEVAGQELFGSGQAISREIALWQTLQLLSQSPYRSSARPAMVRSILHRNSATEKRNRSSGARTQVGVGAAAGRDKVSALGGVVCPCAEDASDCAQHRGHPEGLGQERG